MSSRRKLALFCSLSAWLVACHEDRPPPDDRTEPWPAPAVSSARVPASAQVGYELIEGQRIDFELKTHEARIVGYFPVLEAHLDVDLMHLEKTRGRVRVDLGAVRIEADDEQEQHSRTASASNWLNLGSSIPDATREERRWASFEIDELFDVSSAAAHEGRLQRRAKKAPPSDAGADAEAATGEQRKVFAKARGPLLMNQRRMTEDVRLAVLFSYPTAATPGFPPEQILVESAHALRIPLEPYGIKPRNASGVVVASDLKLLGSTVSRTAQVSFKLRFRQQPGKH